MIEFVPTDKVLDNVKNSLKNQPSSTDATCIDGIIKIVFISGHEIHIPLIMNLQRPQLEISSSVLRFKPCHVDLKKLDVLFLLNTTSITSKWSIESIPSQRPHRISDIPIENIPETNNDTNQELTDLLDQKLNLDETAATTSTGTTTTGKPGSASTNTKPGKTDKATDKTADKKAINSGKTDKKGASVAITAPVEVEEDIVYKPQTKHEKLLFDAISKDPILSTINDLFVDKKDIHRAKEIDFSPLRIAKIKPINTEIPTTQPIIAPLESPQAVTATNNKKEGKKETAAKNPPPAATTAKTPAPVKKDAKTLKAEADAAAAILAEENALKSAEEAEMEKLEKFVPKIWLDDPSVFLFKPDHGSIDGPCVSLSATIYSNMLPVTSSLINANQSSMNDVIKTTTSTTAASTTVTVKDLLNNRISLQNADSSTTGHASVVTTTDNHINVPIESNVNESSINDMHIESDSPKIAIKRILHYPTPVTIEFHPKEVGYYKSKFKCVSEYGNICEFILQGYASHADRLKSNLKNMTVTVEVESKEPESPLVTPRPVTPVPVEITDVTPVVVEITAPAGTAGVKPTTPAAVTNKPAAKGKK